MLQELIRGSKRHLLKNTIYTSLYLANLYLHLKLASVLDLWIRICMSIDHRYICSHEGSDVSLPGSSMWAMIQLKAISGPMLPV